MLMDHQVGVVLWWVLGVPAVVAVAVLVRALIRNARSPDKGKALPDVTSACHNVGKDTPRKKV